MKLSKLALLTALLSSATAGANESRQAIYQPSSNESGVALVGHCDCGEAVCGCEASCGSEAPSCDGGCDSSCDGCGESCGCGMGAGLLGTLGFTGELGEPWALVDELPLGFKVGGWTDIGYHTSNNTGGGINTTGGLNTPAATGAPANFNNYDNRVQLQQQWLYAERIADGSDGFGIGGRIDYIYGTDAPDTQSFGILNKSFDNSWDNGFAYGNAMPQLYGEVAYGNTSVKIGHFFTIVGNEVVAATGNFFYSRQFTFYNAEPFTHTGALVTQTVGDNVTLWGGYVMGWDSGFEDNGDAYLGGVKGQVTDKFSLLYTTCIGRFGDTPISAASGPNGDLERGSINSIISTYQVTDKLLNLIQYDYLDTHNQNGGVVRRTHGLNSYFIYQLTDRVALGSRTEYFNWKSNVISDSNLFNQTAGVNVSITPNLKIRPEMRWIWDAQRTGVNENYRYMQPIFGMDAVLTF